MGNDLIDGGADQDSAHFVQSTAGVVVNLSATTLTVGLAVVAPGTAYDGMGGTDTLINIEGVRGSDFADYIRGSDIVSRREVFRGDAGNDTIDGGAGTEDFASYSDVPGQLGGVNVTLSNGAASVNDRKGGTDTLINIEGIGGTHVNDTLTGGIGNQWFSGNGGNDTIDGGAGLDWVTYFGAPSGVTVNLNLNTATDGYNGASNKLQLGGIDTLSNIENAEGSDFNDSLSGNSGANELRGRLGNDTINGLGGFDKADYGGVAAGYTFSRSGGSFVSISGPDGTDTLSGIEQLVFDDRVLNSVINEDFNADGKSDILWRK